MNLFYGVVEDRIHDPLKLGRVRVRIAGIHSENKIDLPTVDLPWAMVMQPTTSAANSGIGHSPTGILEGTWVMVVFRDEDKQNPIIIGTLPGIPGNDINKVQTQSNNAITATDGTIWTDGSGNPIKTGSDVADVANTTPIQEVDTQMVKKPSALTISAAGIALLHSLEGLSSLVKGKNKIASSSTPDNTIIYAYQDTKQIWTIGWGNTLLEDGSSVNESTLLMKAQCDALFAMTLKSDYEKSARRLIKAPITQSMFDACVSLIYNMGAGGFAKSDILPALNASKYTEAAAHIPGTRNNNGALLGRREKEKAFFLRDGIPKDDGTTDKVLTDPKHDTTAVADATKNPVIIKSRVPTGSSTIPNSNPVQLSESGFLDPNKKYPLFTGEPDTHRLARHEKIDGTIVVKKEAGRAKGIITATGSTWDQPEIPYNASYPYNSVYSSESGHIQEFDDTAGSERIHIYHKAGTYSEIDVNGTQVNRIVGDGYSIYERNGNIIIKGDCNITVQGNASLRVENNTTIESLGNLDIKVGGNIGIGANGDIRLAAGGEISVDGTSFHMNSGKGGSVLKSQDAPTGVTTLSTLSTPNRNDHITYAYDSPEDGDPTIFIQKQVEAGRIDPDVIPPETTKIAEEVIEQKNQAKIDPASCELIMNEKSFTFAYKLTDYWTLDMVLKGDTSREIPTGVNNGHTAQTIVCNLKQLAVNVLDPVKRAYPNMNITNTFRSERANRAIGAGQKSAHSSGQAADIQFSGFSNTDYYNAALAIQKLLPAYDQIILEYGNNRPWLHISYKSTGNKGQVLTIDTRKKETINKSGFTLLDK